MRMRPHPVQQPRPRAAPVIVHVVMAMRLLVTVLSRMPVPVLVMPRVAPAVLMPRVVRAGAAQGAPVVHIANNAIANK